MNYLAHLYLSEDDDAALVGNLMGDFVKGRPERLDYPPAMLRGILLHRRVDSFTDAHPVFRHSRSRLQPPFRRFAGVIIDLAYDHFLARDWRNFSSEPLPLFTRRAYQALKRNDRWLPPRLRHIAPAMEQQDWLGAYSRLDAVGRSLAGIGRRFRRETPLPLAVHELERLYPSLEADFHRFMPELRRFARCERQRLRDDPALLARGP